jgi:hypothetical protein
MIFVIASAGAMLLLFSLPLSAQNDGVSMQQLNNCREIAATEERLACYDSVGEATAIAETPAETPVEIPAETPEVPAAVATVTVAAAAIDAQTDPEPDPESAPEQADDFGFPKAIEDLTTIQANVVRCGEASNRKYYFYLDNGQVWQYLGNRSLRYRSCDSPVTITEDGMGYALQMEGDSSHRVQRTK